MTPAGGDMTACCRAVMAAPRGGCRVSRPAAVAQLRVPARPEGVIASVVTSETGCGSHLAPWRLTALRGQRFNITLVDFAHALSPTGSSSAASSVDRHACYAYAVFKVRCTHTHTRVTALFPGLPGWAGTRKEKPIWILLDQETVSGSGIS